MATALFKCGDHQDGVLLRAAKAAAMRPRGPLPQMAVDVAPVPLMLWPTARIYIRGAGLELGLGRTAMGMAHSLSCSRGLARVHLVLFQPGPRR